MKPLNLMLSAATLALLLSCGSTTDSNGDPDPPPPTEPPVETPTYTLTASASPAEGGSVDPSSGEFEEDEQVSLEASAEPGFAFSRWEGDAEGSGNPITLTMDDDKEVTAIFDDLRNHYSVELTLSDGSDELSLEFGQAEAPGEVVRQAPPAPPEGALHGWFIHEEKDLFADYRDWLQSEVEWELHIQPGPQASHTLSWELEITRMEGGLTLHSESLDLEIDMSGSSSLEFETDQPVSFTITYVADP